MPGRSCESTGEPRRRPGSGGPECPSPRAPRSARPPPERWRPTGCSESAGNRAGARRRRSGCRGTSGRGTGDRPRRRPADRAAAAPRPRAACRATAWLSPAPGTGAGSPPPPSGGGTPSRTGRGPPPFRRGLPSPALATPSPCHDHRGTPAGIRPGPRRACPSAHRPAGLPAMTGRRPPGRGARRKRRYAGGAGRPVPPASARPGPPSS